MRLIDTSAWIEWLIGSPVGETVAQHLPEQDAWLVPTIVQLELTKWLTRERGEDTSCMPSRRRHGGSSQRRSRSSTSSAGA